MHTDDKQKVFPAIYLDHFQTEYGVQNTQRPDSPHPKSQIQTKYTIQIRNLANFKLCPFSKK